MHQDEGWTDYGAAVLDSFARFKQGAVKDYRVAFSHYPEMNHVEAGVLDLVAEIYPDQFAELDRFRRVHNDFLHVPGRSARLFLFDRLFTHFEQAEAPENSRGKLQDDLVRIHTILDAATGRSIIIMNELFTSTTLQNAVFLGTKIIRAIVDLDLLCVYVTFVDELVALGDTTVSMVSTVEPGDPTTRTHKIVRRPADGNAQAIAIAERFGLAYPRLKERLAS